MKQFFITAMTLLAFIACTPDLVPDQPSDVPVQSVELYVNTLDMRPGDIAQLTAKVFPDNASVKTLVWASSDENVATINQAGYVKAIGEGHCTFSATCGDKSAVCEVTVSVPVVPATSVTLDKETTRLKTGGTLQLSATVLPSYANPKTVTWTSSNTDVATVEDGLVTALAVGEATITATAGELSATCSVTVYEPFQYGGMCLEAVSSGWIIISNPLQLTIDYKVEEEDWVSARDEQISISAKAGERVWFRGLNKAYAVENEDLSVTATNIRCSGCYFYLYGNLMSLVCGDAYETATVLTGENTFRSLFSKNSYIINHPSLDIELPATTLSPYCYWSLFNSCTSLTRAPKLPAKILTEGCYAAMFSSCTSLKKFPEMDATDMAYMCCTWMMSGSGIEEAPELPAMNLARACYEFMFMECPNLKKAMTVLPATELAAFCYTGMFQRCYQLETAPELPAQKLVYYCYSHMFNGCKSLTKAPYLPATELNTACYQWMFRDCSSLSYIKADFLTAPDNFYDQTSDWVDGVAAEGTFVKNPDAKWDVRGVNGVPEGWTIE